MKKSTSYRQTFRRHRILLMVPIVLAVLIAGFLVVGAAKSYQSTASLWVDYSAPAGSSIGDSNPALTPPSTAEQNVLTELLATQSFVLAVGHNSQLGQYLASHASSGFSPTALLGASESLNERIMGSFGPKQLTTLVPGPQVLQISFSGPTPAVAQSALNEILTELIQQTNNFSRSHNQKALGYYRTQVQQAAQALSAARSQLNLYRSQHPSAPPSDPNLTALTTAVSTATTNLATANENLTGAGGAMATSASGLSVQVIDAASTPLGPTSGKKKDLEGILGGLFAGALISFLGAVLLTRGKHDPWEDELAGDQAPTGNVAVPVANGAVAAGTVAVAASAGIAPATGGHVVQSPPPPVGSHEPPVAQDQPSLTTKRRFVLPATRGVSHS